MSVIAVGFQNDPLTYLQVSDETLLEILDKLATSFDKYEGLGPGHNTNAEIETTRRLFLKVWFLVAEIRYKLAMIEFENEELRQSKG